MMRSVVLIDSTRLRSVVFRNALSTKSERECVVETQPLQSRGHLHGDKTLSP